jgi:hypothetical protein
MTARHKEFEAFEEEPLLVQADASTESGSIPTSAPQVDAAVDDALASLRQTRGAMWAGGISGLLILGPIGAGLGVWAAHHFSRNDAGDVGKFVRKSGDFASKLGRSIKIAWKEASEDRCE